MAQPTGTLPRVHLSELSQAPGLDAGLREELKGEAQFVRSSTRAEVLVEVRDLGRQLAVRDAQGRALVDRRVAQRGPAATRVFVTLVAQAVRTYDPQQPVAPTYTATAAAPAITQRTKTSSAGAPLDPGVSAIPIAELAGPARAVESEVAQAATATRSSAHCTFGAEFGAQAWTRPLAPRLGGAVRSRLQWGAWSLSFNAGLHGGPALKTADIEARLRAASLDLGGHRDVVELGSARLSADLRAGLALLWGGTKAAEPPFADPGLASSVRLWQPYVQPGLTVHWPLSGRWTTYLALSVRVALADHSLRLPSTFTDQPQTPVHTGWIRPSLALGLRAQVF